MSSIITTCPARCQFGTVTTVKISIVGVFQCSGVGAEPGYVTDNTGKSMWQRSKFATPNESEGRSSSWLVIRKFTYER